MGEQFSNAFTTERASDIIVSNLATFCQQQNPMFKRERWIGYIKGENGSNGGAVKVSGLQMTYNRTRDLRGEDIIVQEMLSRGSRILRTIVLLHWKRLERNGRTERLPRFL